RMARRMIGPLLGGLAVRVRRETQRGLILEALEALAGEAPRIGPRREELQDRSVRASRGANVALRFHHLAERDESHDVAGLLGPPLVRLRERLVLRSARDRI